MSNPNLDGKLTRREFFDKTSKAVVGTTTAGAIGVLSGFGSPTVEAAEELDKSAIVQRRLGRTNIKISHIVGAWDWHEIVIPRAVELGVNYWHKIAGWREIPKCLRELDRDAWYCDVIIDTFKERGAVAQFESARKHLGLEYIDSFKLHSIYQTVEDFKNKTGMLKAFDKLKKQGKVKFLACAQHSGPAAEICSALIESGLFDHIQPAVSIMPNHAQMKMLELAKKHDVGVITKKTMGAVARVKKEPAWRKRIQPHLGKDGKLGAAVIKTMLAMPGVSAVTPLTRNFDQLNDNLTNGGLAVNKKEASAVRELRDFIAANHCSFCGECLSTCSRNVPISDILRYATYHQVYAEPRYASALYARLPVKASDCSACGQCESSCPQRLPVVDKLREAHELMA